MKIVTFSFMRAGAVAGRGRWRLRLGFLGAAPASAQLTLVNMVPASRSGEINQDSEPSLTINRRHPKQLAASAFTWDNLQGPPMIGANAPIYVTVDEGDSWDVAYSVPSTVGAFFPTGDITLWFSEQPSGSTSLLYTSILHSAEFSMRVFRADDYRLSLPMTLLDTQTFGGTNRVDQPRVRAETVHRGPDRGKDRVYVGFNNGYREFGSPVNPLNKSASVDFSLDTATSTPVFNLRAIEARATAGQDGFAIEPAVHHTGVVYAAFFGWRTGPGGRTVSDVIVVRDDHWGASASPFSALVDPGDGVVGVRVVQDQGVPGGEIGNNRLGASNLDIEVDPNDRQRVYVVWGEQPLGSNSQTLHVRGSKNGGLTWSSSDLFTMENAVNPALAINSFGRVGLLYQRVVGGASNPRWEARLSLTHDPAHEHFASPGKLLANTDTTSISPLGIQPTIGDYVHLVSHGREFYGVFSASNFPDKANFPRGVHYQRYVDWNTHRLFANAAKTVTVTPSIDPFFFRYRPDPIHFVQRELQALESQINDIVRAFEAGELPPSPRSPRMVAQLQRFLGSLEREADRLRDEVRRRRARVSWLGGRRRRMNDPSSSRALGPEGGQVLGEK